ncbi:MAG: L,D-transpeptidase family protein [Actinomycetota bacterium]
MATDDSSGATGPPAATPPANDGEPRAPRRPLLVRALLTLAVAAAIVALAIGQVVATDGDDADATTTPSSTASTAPATTSTSTTTIPPTTTTTIPPLAQFSPATLPAVPNGSFRQGSRGPEIAAYELRLVQLHFDPGPVDEVFDAKTRFAVEAFDKLMGWPRDGVIDQAFVDALANFQFAVPHLPTAEADRVEVDLDKQVITLYKGWQVALIAPTSTGNGKRFCGGGDGCQYAVTPVGKYKFDWHHRGWRNGDLGRLYNPWYFNGGIAIHGYTSVPVEPASHGCARIPMHIAEYFGTLVYEDMAVYVVGTEAPPTGSASRPAPAPPTTPPAVPPTPTDTTPVPTTVTPDPAPPVTVVPEATVPPTAPPPATSPPTTSPPDTTPTTTSSATTASSP